MRRKPLASIPTPDMWSFNTTHSEEPDLRIGDHSFCTAAEKRARALETIVESPFFVPLNLGSVVQLVVHWRGEVIFTSFPLLGF